MFGTVDLWNVVISGQLSPVIQGSIDLDRLPIETAVVQVGWVFTIGNNILTYLFT